MKKIIVFLLVLVMVFINIPVSFAETQAKNNEFTRQGMYNVQITSAADAAGVSFTPYTSGTAVAEDGTASDAGLYIDAERIVVEYTSAAAAKYYMIFALKSGTVPTADNIVYINQETAGTTGVAFNLYPSELENDVEYKVYLSTNASSAEDPLLDGKFTQIGSYQYNVPYTLGDVNDDGDIDVLDVGLVLNHIVKNITLSGSLYSAGDVNVDGDIDVLDVGLILNYIVKNITSF